MEATGTGHFIPGGYATPAENGAFAYHYFICDYQGSVRAVVGESGSLEEANTYYPYGMLMPSGDGTMPSFQPIKYGSKEYVTIHGLNQYDFDPRSLFSPTGLFTSPDPMCEADYGVSPYLYCRANPVNRVDPSGLSDYFNQKGKFIFSVDDGSDTRYMVLTKSDKKNDIISALDRNEYILNPTDEILEKMEQIYSETEKDNLERGFLVDEYGNSTDIVVGNDSEIKSSTFYSNIGQLKGITIYDVHSHPKPDNSTSENNPNDTYNNSSLKN